VTFEADIADRAGRILDTARARGVMIATAESCTGGLVAGSLTEVAGSSDVFDRGFVTYSNQAKIDMLGVRPQTLEEHGAVSEQTAAEMADGAVRYSSASLAVSITGIAGPSGGTAQKPVGLVCFGLAVKGQETLTDTVRFADHGRAAVRLAALRHALTLLERTLI
jgi:nicotinamide-nucleotide amidase